MKSEDLTREILEQCRNMAELYGRTERKKNSKKAEAAESSSVEEKQEKESMQKEET